MLLLVLACAWPLWLINWASSQITHVPALSGAADTPGTTYLIAGSDARDENSPFNDGTEGRRSDSIIVLHTAENGQSAMVSIPRDTWVEIPGYDDNKINASYSFGGEALLVQTVEQLTGLTVDHFVEVGMGGVTNIVDAVGGVELCLDYDVEDEKSELSWTTGCHITDGKTALAFARMRYSDPEGDIGRARRQREVISAVAHRALTPSTLINPSSAKALASAGARAVTTDPDTSALDLGRLVLAFRSASNAGLTGAPPISSINMETYAGSAVELDEHYAPVFFDKLRDGTLTPADFNAAP